MRKEFSTFLQFAVIAGLGVVYYRFVITSLYPDVSPEALEAAVLEVEYWLYSFIGLSAIWSGLCCIKLRQASVDSNRSLFELFANEISKTGQYFIIAIFSTFSAFWIIYLSVGSSGFSPDPISLWFGVRHSSFIWLPAFCILSLVRLGIVGAANIYFYKKSLADN